MSQGRLNFFFIYPLQQGLLNNLIFFFKINNIKMGNYTEITVRKDNKIIAEMSRKNPRLTINNYGSFVEGVAITSGYYDTKVSDDHYESSEVTYLTTNDTTFIVDGLNVGKYPVAFHPYHFDDYLLEGFRFRNDITIPRTCVLEIEHRYDEEVSEFNKYIIVNDSVYKESPFKGGTVIGFTKNFSVIFNQGKVSLYNKEGLEIDYTLDGNGNVTYKPTALKIKRSFTSKEVVGLFRKLEEARSKYHPGDACDIIPLEDFLKEEGLI